MNNSCEINQGKKILEIIDLHRHEAGALLPVLHAIQENLGFIPEPSLSLIARSMNLSRAEVYGVVTFYHYFRLTPHARHLVQICRAEACQARGANQLIAHVEQQLGCQFHGTSKDGTISLEPIYCLGQCAVGPAILIDESNLYARVDNAIFDELIKEFGDGQ